jgi:hypothetical protein
LRPFLPGLAFLHELAVRAGIAFRQVVDSHQQPRLDSIGAVLREHQIVGDKDRGMHEPARVAQKQQEAGAGEPGGQLFARRSPEKPPGRQLVHLLEE